MSEFQRLIVMSLNLSRLVLWLKWLMACLGCMQYVILSFQNHYPVSFGADVQEHVGFKNPERHCVALSSNAFLRRGRGKGLNEKHCTIVSRCQLVMCNSTFDLKFNERLEVLACVCVPVRQVISSLFRPSCAYDPAYTHQHCKYSVLSVSLYLINTFLCRLQCKSAQETSPTSQICRTSLLATEGEAFRVTGRAMASLDRPPGCLTTNALVLQ